MIVRVGEKRILRTALHKLGDVDEHCLHKKRKADDAGNEDASRWKRRILAERTQAGPENEFATRAGKYLFYI